MSGNPLDDIKYRPNLKVVSFVADSREGAKAGADAWLNDFSKHGPIHFVGAEGFKTGQNIYVFTVVYSDA